MKYVPAIALAVLLVIAAVVALVRFEQYEVEMNYLVFSYVPCDETQDVCYGYGECDTADPECVIEPYMKVSLPASMAPGCIFDNSCQSDFVCDASIGCSKSPCADDTLDEGEFCIE